MYQIDFHKPLHIHFIGIGGISMSGLAEILLGRISRFPVLIPKKAPLPIPWKKKVPVFSTDSAPPISQMT